MRIFFPFLLALSFHFSSLALAEEANSIIVCENGVEMFQWDLDFVRKAEQSIEISAVFLGGDIARELFKVLDERLTQVPHLQVYLLTSPYLLEPIDWEMLKALQAKYPRNLHVEHATTITIMWPDIAGIDNHIKMFIVDEKYFSSGGTNLDYPQCSEGTFTPERKTKDKISPLCDSLPSGMRDQDIVGKGALAKDLRISFYKLYALWEDFNKTNILKRDPEHFKNQNAYFPVTKQGQVARFDNSERQRFIAPSHIKKTIGGPHQEKNTITDRYVQLIKEAKQEIVIENLYFFPTDAIFKALLDAVNRGIKLTVVTNGISDISPEYSSLFCWATRMQYVPVLYGNTYHFWDAWDLPNKPIKNTRIFEYHVRDVLLHKKAMIVDRKKSIVGSYNLGTRSDMGDYEMIIEMDSAEIAEDILKVFQRDLQVSREVSPAEARSWYFDPVTSYIAELQKRFHGLL